MSNTYRATGPAGAAAFEDGVFEREFSPSEEADWLGSGVLELVPRKYRQLSNNYSATEAGETFEAAFPVETEAALIAGGHIERVDVDELEEMTVAELQAYAEERGIDLGSAKTKPKIIRALRQ